MPRPAVLCSLALAASSLSAQGQVWIVDDDGGAGVDFTDLGTAIAAAASGDTLLVRDGAYGAFAIDGKGLSVLAETGHAPTADGMAVYNLASNQTVLLRGLSTGAAFEHGIDLEGNDGAVRVEDCALVGQDGHNVGEGHPNGFHGARLNLNANVAFVRCSLLGGIGANNYEIEFDTMGAGGLGMNANASSVAFYGSTVTGGRGGSDFGDDVALGGWVGGAGVSVNNGFVFASGSDFAGGQGGSGGTAFLWGGCGNGGAGGAGAIVTASSELIELASSFTGGPGGFGVAYYGCSNGPAGASMVANGAHSVYSSDAKGFEAPAPVREGEASNLVFEGTPGDIAVVGVSADAGFASLASLNGVLLTGTTSVIFAGAIPGSGSLTLPITGPYLPASFDSAAFWLQAAFVDAGLVATLGPASPMVVVDEAF